MYRVNNYLYLILVIALVQCSSDRIAGGGSDLPDKNVVVGKIYSTDQLPAANTQVVIIPAGYIGLHDAPISPEQIDTTDVAGNFHFKGCPTGNYNIQAIHISRRTRLLITGVAIGDDTTRVPADTLRIPGAVKVFVPDSATAATYHVYFEGTTITASVTAANRSVIIDSVPAGKIPKICFLTKDDSVPSAVRYNLIVSSGDTAVVSKPLLNYSQRLSLNTTASGANVRGDVFNIPVLIRLHSGNFNFSEAAADGADIRFAKSDTAFLPCEIERWDPVLQQAELWVKVDTVRGNDGTQFITMYWSNPGAPGSSNGAAVFDTANGFSGVWHLSETSGQSAADATGNGVSGTFRGGLPNSKQSPLGICQSIARADSDYVDMGNVLNPGPKNLSISVWIKRGSMVTPQGIITKTDGDLPKAGYGYQLSLDPGNFPHFNIAVGGAVWGDNGTFDLAGTRAITDSTTWHHLFVVIDRTGNRNCRMYVDGVDCTGSMTGDVAGLTEVVNPAHFRIGTENDNNASYRGLVDEVTVAFTVRSADWVTLCFMNQREQDALVQW